MQLSSLLLISLLAAPHTSFSYCLCSLGYQWSPHQVAGGEAGGRRRLCSPLDRALRATCPVYTGPVYLDPKRPEAQCRPVE